MATTIRDMRRPPAPPAAPIDPMALPDARKFLIFGVMAFGQFMALIDIQIVAASLNEVQAGLSAGPDEISWVQTAYLMAELVMIPFSAFLAQALSTRWLFTLSAALFTLSSALCGLAWNIETMIIFRAIQGFVGGAMVPTVFATPSLAWYRFWHPPWGQPSADGSPMPPDGDGCSMSTSRPASPSRYCRSC
jgi:DHA2 family multidrug resistance protein